MLKNNFKLLILLLLCLFLTIPFTGTYFSDSGLDNSNSFSAKCWQAPIVSTLNFPVNDSSINTTNVAFDWLATTSSCPIATIIYNFQIYSDAGLTTLVLQSGFSEDLSYIYNSILEGEYWWRVQAKDQYNNLSNSFTNRLTVDRTLPLTPTMSITGSWNRAVEEKINNSDFETGDLSGWTSAGNIQLLASDSISNPTTIINPFQGNYMVRVGNPDNPGNYVWENRLMQSFDSGAKSLSLRYNFFSRETAGFDQPGFFIRLNGQEIYKLNSFASDGTNALSTDWSEFYYDLSNLNDSKVNLAVYAGNTSDTNSQSWAYIDKITTYFISAPSDAKYYLSGNDNPGGSGINHFEYLFDGSSWNILAIGGYFQILTGGDRTIYFRAVDNAGNYTAAVPVRVITDTSPPSTIADLTVSSTDVNTANLTWTAPGNDGSSGKAASYDVRYSTTNIIDDASFNSSTKVDKVPSPQTAGSTETLEIIGLNPSTTYYFAIKSSDEAPNNSSLSNVQSAATLAGATVNPGDIVINELMWMGTNASTDDQYIELRNMTDHDIDLSNFTIDKYDGSGDALMLTIPVGKTISAKGYFLISNFALTASNLKDSISVDYETTDVDLSNINLSIKLYDTGPNKIDEAWNGTAPTEGFYQVGSKYYSMERISVPGDGTNQLSWYTCLDEASMTDFFDGGADERGTPGAENRSENEPPKIPTPGVESTPTETPSPTVSPDPSLEPSPVDLSQTINP